MFTINSKFRELAVAAIQIFFKKVVELFSMLIGGAILLVISSIQPIFGLRFKTLAWAIVRVIGIKIVELFSIVIGCLTLSIISVGWPIFWLVDKRRERLQGSALA
jgi:hypothetical protein